MLIIKSVVMLFTGQWSCSTCLVSNPADKKECLACGTPPPTSSKEEPPKAKPITSNWGNLLPDTSGMSVYSWLWALLHRVWCETFKKER